MPVIEAHILQGFDDTDKTHLCTALTDAVLQVVPASPDLITIQLHEMPQSHYMRGRTHRTPAPARTDPITVVQGFLSAMQARDLERAQRYLAPDFVMHFPDTAPMSDLADLVAWAKPRYQYVEKSYAGFDVSVTVTALVVYARGTSNGAWPDGRQFDNIRFVDRFEIENDQITRQEVWNDIAETLRTEASA